MTREQLFEHLMENDPEFRKEVVSSATVAGMDLYQAALSMLDKDEKNDVLASATGRSQPIINSDEAQQLRKGPSSRKLTARAKAARAREKGKTTEMRAQQRKNNERIRAALIKILTTHGPMTLNEIKAKMHPKTAALAGNGQCFHNQMYALKAAKQIRWTKGAKRPNVKWEIVP